MAGGIRRLPGRAARRLGRLFDAHSPLAPPARRGLRAGRAEREGFARSVAAGPVSAVTAGPLVSIVVVGRAPEQLPTWLDSLADWTAYGPIEVLTGSATPDDRAAVIDALIAQARGELVCLLDPRARPLRSDWLGHLVGGLADDATATGPTLVRRPARGPVRYGQHSADLSVLSRGLDFARRDGIVRPVPIGLGDDPFGAGTERVEVVPGLSLACLLVRRGAMSAAGGYPSGYRSDLDDAAPDPALYAAADLACRVRAQGGSFRLVGSALVGVRPARPARPAHDGPARAGSMPTTIDRDTFTDRFGPRLRREVLDDVLAGRREWSRRPIRVAFIGDRQPTADERAAVGPLTADTDIVVVSAPGCAIREVPAGIVRVAWVGDPVLPGLDDYDVVIAESPSVAAAVRRESSKTAEVVDPEIEPVSAILNAVGRWNDAIRYGIRIGASSWSAAERWGDYHFARSLQRWLERAGHPTTVRLLDDWTSEAAARDDVTVHLFGKQAARNRVGQVNVLWQISHPALASGELYDTYDLAFVASSDFAVRMAGLTRVPVAPLLQATDPERFFPEPTGPFHDVLFVANQRADRPVAEWLAGTDLDLAIYGNGWESQFGPRYLRGERIRNEDLHRYYSSAAVVLNDTWADMRAEGFIPNRILDALASGAFVVSDDVAGLSTALEDSVPVYRDAEGLRRSIDLARSDPARRRAFADRGRAIVLAQHTFEQRVEVIRGAVRALSDERPMRLTAAPTRPLS